MSAASSSVGPRKVIADHSTSDLIDRCLKDLDLLLKLTDEPDMSSLPQDDGSLATSPRDPPP
ncbi:hypothetical protein EON64_15500 [archaeon]|nr:MAG: hypothetical protein EON64_15500 [archaeon]